MKTPNELLEDWSKLCLEIEELDVDVQKSLVKGNFAASRRARVQFRALKKTLTEFSRELVVLDKARKQEKGKV